MLIKVKYDKITKAAFISRPNRFLANVIIDGKNEKVHVKNTGRLRELLTEGADVILEEADKRERKTKYSLIAVYKDGNIVNIDSQAPNVAAYEAVKAGKITEIGIPSVLKREVKYKNSRFDIYYERGDKKGFIEVKGVTLNDNGTAKFPDAPTERGAKHIRELAEASGEGFECSVLFVIQMKNINNFKPNYATDPLFSKELENAGKAGVNILAYDCVTGVDFMEIDKKVEVIMSKPSD